ncbi:Zinc fyve domain containing protein [Rutstroemia sp. NJR-2017a WRK4]|nr:Zinc fyve domain containing protein [Rutstroemia sp. NJR-2017a WRK4]
MSDPPSYDQDLLSRLNALKKSNISLSAAPNPSLNVSGQEKSPETDLSERLRSLRNGTLSKSTPTAPSKQTSHSRLADETRNLALEDDIDPFFGASNENDDKTLDELLEEIGPEAQWLNPDDQDDVQKLLNEAKDVLRNKDTGSEPSSEHDQEQKKKDASTILTSGLDMSVFQLDDESEDEGKKERQDLETESREVQDIVAKLLDEVNLEREGDGNAGDEDAAEEEKIRNTGSRSNPATDDHDDNPSITLPSVPSKLPDPPQPSRQSLDFENDISARLAALQGLGSSTNPLGLPSAPTAKPVSKAAEPVIRGLKKYTDDEIEAWCIICQDDATVECAGCEGDLYCARCWKEGHMGPDAGYEFKRHQWKKYVKPS